jgi:ATP-dependent DNA helicase RecQ
MVAAGLLEIDIAGYGGLRATPAGMALLSGEGAFRYRQDRISKDPKAKRETAAAKAADAQLLRSLKTLRLELAKERGVPAYVIFSDRSLVDMAAKRPGTQDDFADVYGVGDAKLRDFAPIFLQAIAENAAVE